MTLSTVLLMPWRASPRSTNVFAMGIVALVVAGVVAVACFAQLPGAWLVAVVVLALGEVFLWVSWLAGISVLAWHAARLRLPGVQRHAVAALVLHALLTVALPAVLVGMSGFGVAPAFCILGLAATGGMLVAVMPVYVYLLLWLAGLAIHASPLVVALPSPGDRLFVPCALLAMAGLILACIGRWWQLLRRPEACESPWRRLIVMQWRADTRGSGWAAVAAAKGHATSVDMNLLIRRRPDWLQPHANLAHVGPQNRVAALRVALGGMFMPVTGLARLARWVGWLLGPAAILVFFSLVSGSQPVGYKMLFELVSNSGLRALVPFATFAAIVVAVSSNVHVQRYWQQRHDELALLALLPRLGDAEQAKRGLLRASVMVPLRLQLALLVVSLLVAWVTAAGVGACLLIVLPLLCSAVYVASASVATLAGMPPVFGFGGREFPQWRLLAVAMLAGLLLAATIITQVIGARQSTPAWLAALFVSWAVICIGLACHWRSAWRALQRRPHVFLPN